MNIEELIEVLKKYPSSHEVLITWEGALYLVEEKYIYEGENNILYLDAFYNNYRECFEKK